MDEKEKKLNLGFRVAAAAEAGIGHILEKKPCQDVAAGRIGEACAVLALSDGAGSCAHSEQAAERAVDWALSYIPKHFDELVGGESILSMAKAEFIKSGQKALLTLSQPLEESGCTLLFFAVVPDGRWVCGHIGDGIAFLTDKEGPHLLSRPENGEYRNETFFLNSPVAEQHLRIQTGRLQGEACVLLSSDGCEDTLYDGETKTIARAVNLMSEWLASHDEKEVEEALHRNLQDKFASFSEDDLSIALLYCYVKE